MYVYDVCVCDVCVHILDVCGISWNSGISNQESCVGASAPRELEIYNDYKTLGITKVEGRY